MEEQDNELTNQNKLWPGKSSVLSPQDEVINGSALALGHYRLGKIFYDKSDLKKAEDAFMAALPSWDKKKDAFFKFKTLGFLIRISIERSELDKVGQYILLSEELLRDIEESTSTYSCEYYYYKGMLYVYKGDFKKAKEFFELTNEKAKKEDDTGVLAKSCQALGNAFFHLKDYNKALEYLDHLQEILNSNEKYYLQGTMHFLYGQIYAELKQHQLAIFHFQKSRTILQEKTCWNLLGHLLHNEGKVYLNMGQMNKALFFFEFALQTIPVKAFKRLSFLIQEDISHVNDNNVDIVLDRANRVVYEKKLGAIDFRHRFVLLEILFLLARNPGKYFDKEELARAIWKDEYNPLIHDKLIYTSVSRLRKLIEPKKNKRKYIVRGKDGYALGPFIKIRFHRQGPLEANPNVANVDMTTPV